MVGDDDVDARGRRGGDLGDARRPGVDGHDQRDALRAPRPRPPPSTARGPPRAATGRTGVTRSPSRRNASTSWARPVSPSASKSPNTMTRSPRSARGRDAGDQRGRVRQEPGSLSPAMAGPRKAASATGSAIPRRAITVAAKRPDALLAARPRGAPGRAGAAPGRPSDDVRRSLPRRMPRTAYTGTWPARITWPRGGWGGPRSPAPGGGPPTGATRRGAGSR